MTDPVVVRLLAAIDSFEQCAIAAGHGFGHRGLGTELNAGWTQLDLSDNVRPTYDQRFLRLCGPDHVQRLCQSHRDIVNLYTGALFTQSCHPEYEGNNGYVEAMAAVVGVLARGYGVEDGEMT